MTDLTPDEPGTLETDAVLVRSLKPSDLEALIEIDAAAAGRRRPSRPRGAHHRASAKRSRRHRTSAEPRLPRRRGHRTGRSGSSSPPFRGLVVVGWEECCVAVPPPLLNLRMRTEPLLLCDGFIPALL